MQVFEKDLYKYILRAKKLLWYKKNEIQKKKKIEALEYIKGLLDSDNTLKKSEKEEKFKLVI